MTAYRQILVALDQTPLSQEVFDQACTEAKAHQAKLLLLHCLTLPQSTQLDYGDRYRANLSNFLAIAQKEAETNMEQTRQWLEAYVHQAESMGLEADWDWRLGEAGPEICAAAAHGGVDLVMLGRRGRRGVQEVLLGSVSNYVMHRAPCSVLVVQGH